MLNTLLKQIGPKEGNPCVPTAPPEFVAVLGKSGGDFRALCCPLTIQCNLNKKICVHLCVPTM